MWWQIIAAALNADRVAEDEAFAVYLSDGLPEAEEAFAQSFQRQYLNLLHGGAVPRAREAAVS